MRHVYECQMRRADLHGDTVSNVAFVDYLQEARLDLLRYHHTSPTPNPGEGLVVVNTVVEYLAPLRLSQAPLYVAVWPTEVRAASFTMGYELFTGTPDAPVLHGRATTVAHAVRLHLRAASSVDAGGAGPAHSRPSSRRRCPTARSPREAPSGGRPWWRGRCTCASPTSTSSGT